MFEGYKDVLTVDQMVEILNIGRNKAYELLNTGLIKSFRIGKIHRIPKKYIIDYIENNAI